MSDITVIIPAYNAVKTVERTIRSVMASVIPLEVWVVDDGSTDGTGSLLDELVGRQGEWKSSSTLRVIHQANCGAYQARLAALRQIATPYFGFVDADDRVEPEMFAKMLDFARADSLDVVQVGYRGPSTGERRILADRALWRELVRPIILEGRGSSFIWDKLYRNQYDFESFDPTNHVTNWDDLISASWTSRFTTTKRRRAAPSGSSVGVSSRISSKPSACAGRCPPPTRSALGVGRTSAGQRSICETSSHWGSAV